MLHSLCKHLWASSLTANIASGILVKQDVGLRLGRKLEWLIVTILTHKIVLKWPMILYELNTNRNHQLVVKRPGILLNR